MQIGKPWDVPANGINSELEFPNIPNFLPRAHYLTTILSSSLVYLLKFRRLPVNRREYMGGNLSIIIGFQQ